MARVLVTGGTGFLGSYMARSLAESGDEVIATRLPPSGAKGEGAHPGVELVPLDVTDRAAVHRVIAARHPEVIYHFAGQAFVIPSWENPEHTFDVNLIGTLHLLEAVRRNAPRTLFAFAGSGTEYGAPDQIPTPESAPLRPESPYAASKAAADLLAYQYFRSFQIPVFRYRIFGTTGWGKRGDSTNDFASQIAGLEHSMPPRIIQVGNLDKRRDITDARDAVRAMRLVVERGTPGEAYNIASGEARHVGETLRALLDLTQVPIDVEIDPARLRLVDEPVHLADVSRLRSLGWSPRIPFRQTLIDILEGWRASLEKPGRPTRRPRTRRRPKARSA